MSRCWGPRKKSEIERMSQIFNDLGLGKIEDIPAGGMKEVLRHNAIRDYTEFAQSEICGKSIYPTESDARRVILSRKRHGAGFLRPYFCYRCKSYHITSSRPRNVGAS